ncbi:hypothetical protein RYX36_032875 [Vicia faba]
MLRIFGTDIAELPLVATSNSHHGKDYVYSKTVIEKYMLSCGNNENGEGLEVVTLLCGVVGEGTLQLFGKIPLVHVDDVCEAHNSAWKVAQSMEDSCVLVLMFR